MANLKCILILYKNISANVYNIFNYLNIFYNIFSLYFDSTCKKLNIILTIYQR